MWHTDTHIPTPPHSYNPPPPPTHPNTTHLWLFPGRLPSVQSLRKEEVAIFLNGQKDEASHQGAQVVDHIVHTCTCTHALLVPKQMPQESKTMRTLLHIHAKNRIWTPVARSLLQPGFEHQGQDVCCNQDLNTRGRCLLQPGFEHQWQEVHCNLSHS